MDLQQALTELEQDVQRLKDGSPRQRAFARRREAQVSAVREAVAESARLAEEALQQAAAAQAQAQQAAQRLAMLQDYCRLYGVRLQAFEALPASEANRLAEARRMAAPLLPNGDLTLRSDVARERFALQALFYTRQREHMAALGQDPDHITWFLEVYGKTTKTA